MTPDQVKTAIREEYARLSRVARQGRMRESAIYGIIARRCREGARHNGIPAAWADYLPEELR